MRFVHRSTRAPALPQDNVFWTRSPLQEGSLGCVWIVRPAAVMAVTLIQMRWTCGWFYLLRVPSLMLCATARCWLTGSRASLPIRRAREQ
eukprot:13572202-Alexandrium_andersonii.AAC.1